MRLDVLNEPGVILVDDFIGLLGLECLILIHKDLVLAPWDIELLCWRQVNLLQWWQSLQTRLGVNLLRPYLTLWNKLLSATRLKLIINIGILIDIVNILLWLLPWKSAFSISFLRIHKIATLLVDRPLQLRVRRQLGLNLAALDTLRVIQLLLNVISWLSLLYLRQLNVACRHSLHIWPGDLRVAFIFKVWWQSCLRHLQVFLRGLLLLELSECLKLLRLVLLCQDRTVVLALIRWLSE